MDVFDWLDVIGRLRDEGLTQAEVGGRVGWSRGTVSQYILIHEKVATEVLELAKQYQNGRVVEKTTSVVFTFTEGWFRSSGLYDINEEHQEKLGGRVGWSRDLVARYTALQDKVVTQVLSLAKEHQTGRGTENVTPATFTFTERWFRSSRLYDLNEKYQLALQVKRARQTAQRGPKNISREITRE